MSTGKTGFVWVWVWVWAGGRLVGLSPPAESWKATVDLPHVSLMSVWQVSSKDEDFLDLSVDVEQNTSITHCLR